jgi:hypothetical protein
MGSLMRAARHQFAVCVVLATIAVVLTFIGSTLIKSVGEPLVILLFGAEIDRSGGVFAARIVNVASRLLPQSDRAIVDEWQDHIRATGEGGLLPLFTALSIALLAAPRMAIASRWRFTAFSLLWSYGAACRALYPPAAATAAHRRPGESSGRFFLRFAVFTPRLFAVVATPLVTPYAYLKWRKPSTKAPHLPAWLQYAVGLGLVSAGSVAVVPLSESDFLLSFVSVVILSVTPFAMIGTAVAAVKISKRLVPH